MYTRDHHNHDVEYNDQWNLKEKTEKKPNEGSQANREVRKKNP